MSKKLIFNSFSGITLYFVNLIIAFVMSPVMVRALGNRDYGLWELVMSVVGYMGLLDLGIGPALVRFVSVADGRDDRDDLQRTVSTSLAFFLCIGLSALLCFGALGVFPQVIAGGQVKKIASLGTIFFLLGVNAALMFPLQVFIATLMGVQRHCFLNSSRAVLAVMRAVLAFYLLLRSPGMGLIILALLTPAFTSVQFLLFAWAIHTDPQIPPITISAVSRVKMKELFSFGVKTATMLVASRLQNQSVPLIIGNVLGLGSVVYFVIPNRIIEYAKGVSNALSFPVTPYLGAVVGRGDRGQLLRSWFNTATALQALSLAMPLVILLYGPTFLELWIGHEYAIAGRTVIYVLLVGLLADSLAANSYVVLTAQSLHGRCASFWLLLSAFSIPIGIWGAKMWGVSGVTLGTTFVTVIGNCATVRLACSSMEISVYTYFKMTLGPLILPLILFAFSLWSMSSLYPPQGYLAIAVELLVGGVVYTWSLWTWVLTAEMKNKLLAKSADLWFWWAKRREYLKRQV